VGETTTGGWRSRESYIAKDPAKRAKQLANLRGIRKKKLLEKVEARAAAKKNPNGYADDPVGFLENEFYTPKTGGTIRLLDFQKRILRDLFCQGEGNNPSLAILGMCKKSGKSTLAAGILLWQLVNRPFSESYLMGPDLEQGQLVIFSILCRAIRLHPVLRDTLKIKNTAIENESNGATLKVLSCSKTSAGLGFDLVVFDELWQFTSTEARRTIDELTNIPGKDNLILVMSYAGFESDEDTHLYRWYKLGREQETGAIARDPKFYFYWRTNYEGIPWVSADYLATQRKRLTENAYRRFHENAWTQPDSAFINGDTIDKCTVPGLLRGRACRGPVFVGVDIGLKHDCSAVVVVGAGQTANKLALYDHAIWKPTPGKALNLEHTVEQFLLDLRQRYSVDKVFFDPWQAQSSAQRLGGKLPMREYPQTSDRMSEAAMFLKQLLDEGRIELYDSSEIRAHLLNCEALETVRGVRLNKMGGQSNKIDLAVALAMACAAGRDRLVGRGPTLRISYY